MHLYEVRPRKDYRGVDLISDVLPFGRFWYGVGNIESFNFPMRYKLLCLVLLLEILIVSTQILRATDLRGGVVGLAVHLSESRFSR